jgi:formylglycine-generating enzyme required for sulfatase activity
MFLFTATFLFAGNGILRVSANMSDVDIYNGDEQIAMLGQDLTSIELPKGKYTIVLKKPIDEEKEYFASKSVFVGEDTVVMVKFELEKRFTPKGLEQEKIREEKNRIEKEKNRIEKEKKEEKNRIEKEKKEEKKKNAFKSQGFEYKGSYIIPAMVKINAGTFQMGSNINDDEKPIHEVSIKNDFYMGKYEVTFAEYDKFCENTNRKKPDDDGFGRGTKPVINVSWNDANEYAKWLSKKTGQNYKLPSETQWEYATKAGTNTKYSFGDDENQLAQYAWYTKNSNGETHNVGSKKANPWGLYDVHGNVWEWLDDWYINNYKNTPRDEDSNIKGEKNSKVIRGGSWYN